MATQRRSKSMPTEGQATKFLYTILKQLDLKTVFLNPAPYLGDENILMHALYMQIDWSLVATELEISNGHAARMRYSRFKQQMEGTTTIPKTTNTKPKKSNGKTDSSKGTTGKSTKGKSACDKGGKISVNTSGSCKTKNDGLRDGNTRKRSAPHDFMKQETMSYGMMSSIEREQQQMNDSNMMLDPSASGLSYFAPSNGMAFGSDTSFPYMQMQPPFQQQQQSYDYSSNFLQQPEDTTMFNPAFVPDIYDAFNSDPFVGHQTGPPSWDQDQMEFCFSGCCQPPPPHPQTPFLHQRHSLDCSELPLFCQSQPWTPEPFCQPQPQNLWVPIKSEPGSEENSDDILVKVEADAQG